jgi:LuxR family maltose regulon positive regulatory protein
MTRSFRLVPPEPRPDVLTRPRLLRSLVGRWRHRVTSLVGGPGLGKTTLLAQAIADNRMVPRGRDHWIGIEPHDADADRLARVVTAAIENGPDGDGGQDGNSKARGSLSELVAPDPAAVADEVWRRAPTEACLVLDDVHVLPPSSTGAAWLSALVAALPTNGHVVFASRSEPPVPLSRYGSQGGLLWLAEDELRFSDEELSGFASRRGIDPRRFEETGGWPAMAELAASVDERFTGTYLWEEVLGPLGTVRRHVLAVLCDLGGADDDLVSAAVGSPVELARDLEGVPLVQRNVDGWHVPHGLWRTAPGIALDPSERLEIRRRAANHLVDRGAFDEAFSLIQETGLWDAAPAMLRSACLASDRLAAHELERWLAASSESVRASTAGRLASGLHAAFTAPARAVQPLEDAVTHCRSDRDTTAELAALGQLGRLAWWRQDLPALEGLAARVGELEAAGQPKARELAALGRALVADLQGDDETVLAELANIEALVLDPAVAGVATWLAGVVRVEVGQAEAADALAARLLPDADPVMRYILETVQIWARWTQGRIEEATAMTPGVIAGGRAAGVGYMLYVGLSMASIGSSHLGDVFSARWCRDGSLTVAPSGRDDHLPVHSAVATASLQLAEGEEKQAAATLREAYEIYGLDRGLNRRAWRQSLPLSYVLVPETRPTWDETALRGYARTARDLAAAVVELREGDGSHRLRTLELPELGHVRAALHYRFAVELAVGLAQADRPEASSLLDSLGPVGRSAVRDLANEEGRQAKSARTLLATVPAPPQRQVHLEVLGPLVLHSDGPGGPEISHPDLRRKRVLALVAYLVGHRRTIRSAVCDALWPELDERSAANNLGVTLNRLLHLLEPWRDAGEPGYLVRVEGQTIRLVTGAHLGIDVDQFDQHLEAAAHAEAEGTPSVALEHHLAAVQLYRDELMLDVPDADWLQLDREHYRTRFVSAAVRAGQLLLGRGDTARAHAVAHRALAVDPWSEEAYAVLVGAALDRGDRSGAHRLLDHCLAALADLGADPSETTRQLQRRISGDD